jgi:hypothetical protein
MRLNPLAILLHHSGLGRLGKDGTQVRVSAQPCAVKGVQKVRTDTLTLPCSLSRSHTLSLSGTRSDPAVGDDSMLFSRGRFLPCFRWWTGVFPRFRRFVLVDGSGDD